MFISTDFNPIETCFFIRKLDSYEPELVNKVKKMIVAMFLNSDWWNGNSFFDKSIVVDPNTHYNFYYTWGYSYRKHAHSSFSFTNIPFHEKLMESLSIPNVSFDPYENRFITNTGAEGTIGKSGRIVSKGTEYNFFEIRDFIFKEGKIVIKKKKKEYGIDNDKIKISKTQSTPKQGYGNYNSKQQFNFSLESCYDGYKGKFNKKTQKWEEINENRYKISCGIEAIIDNAFLNEWVDDDHVSSIPNICVIINVINDFDEKIRLMYQYNCNRPNSGAYKFDWKIMNDTMYKKIVWKHKQRINN